MQGCHNPIFLYQCSPEIIIHHSLFRRFWTFHQRTNLKTILKMGLSVHRTRIDPCTGASIGRTGSHQWNGIKNMSVQSQGSCQHDGCNKQGSKDHGPGKDKEESMVRFFLMRQFFLFHCCFTFMTLLCRCAGRYGSPNPDTGGKPPALSLPVG